MRRKTPILSISLLTSGTRDTLWRCLDSLMPIRKSIESELIIVDTGCSEEIRTQLLQYTTRIIPFAWCNDFSKARNAGLKQASGEWFLYVDDDECFTDVEELISFFLSGEYKEYGSADYKLRNYLDKEEKGCQDVWVSRLFSLEPETCFHGRIHEFLYPIKGKKKILHCAAAHFGYAFSSNQDKYAHFMRNVSLLKEELDHDREEVRWWIQLAQEYYGVDEYEKLAELCREALDYYKNWKHPVVDRCVGSFYCGILMTDMKLYDISGAETVLKEALADRRITDLAKARLYVYAGELAIQKKKYDDAERCFENYLEIYHFMKDKEDELSEQSLPFVQDAFLRKTKNYVYAMLLDCGLQKGTGIAMLKKYFHDFGWQEERLSLYEGTVENIVKIVGSVPLEAETREMGQTLMDNPIVAEVVVKTLQDCRKKGDVFWRWMELLSQLAGPHYYIRYAKILWLDMTGSTDDLQETFEELFCRLSDIFSLEKRIFEIGQEREVDLDIAFCKIPFDRWKSAVDVFFGNCTREDAAEKEKLLLTSKKAENIRYDYFEIKLVELYLRIYCIEGENSSPENIETDQYEILHEQMQDFVSKNLSLYSRYFKEEAFQGEMELLPAPCRAAVELKKAMESKEIPEVTGHLKNAISYYPPFAGTLKQYAGLYGAHKSEQLERQTEKQVSPEMQQLAGQLKEKVRMMLEQGMQAEAYATIMQMKALLPGDRELLELEELCRRIMS